MHTVGPAGRGLLLQGAASEHEPREIEKVELLVDVRPPDHHRCRIGHQAEALLTLAQRGLDATASIALHEQSANQQCLCHEDGADTDDVQPVASPQRGFPKEDDAAGGEAGLADAPTGQLARVECRDLGYAIGGNVLGTCAAGDT